MIALTLLLWSSQVAAQQPGAALRLLAQPIESGRCVTPEARAFEPLRRRFGDIKPYSYQIQIPGIGRRVMTVARDSIGRDVSYAEISVAPDSTGEMVTTSLTVGLTPAGYSGSRMGAVKPAASGTVTLPPVAPLDSAAQAVALSLAKWVHKRCGGVEK